MRIFLVVNFLIAAVLCMTSESRANYVDVTDYFGGSGTCVISNNNNLQDQTITTTQNVVIIGSDTYSGDTTVPNLSWSINGSYYDMSGNLLGTFSGPLPSPQTFISYTNAMNYLMSSVEYLGSCGPDCDNVIYIDLNRTSNSGYVQYGYSYGGDYNEPYNSLGLTSNVITFGSYPISYSDVVAPIPASAWLFGSALLGLVGIQMKLQARSY